MNQEDFLQIVAVSTFLGAERQKKLSDNAPLMTDEERKFLAKRIQETGASIDQSTGVLADTLEKAIKDFKRQELPKIVKGMEKAEKGGEEEAVNKLLGSL